MKKLKLDKVWVIAYVISGEIDKVQRELAKYPEYAEVEAYIPTIKILKKTFKKEDIFEEVPLLFNYGFFAIPLKYAVYRTYLDNMQKNISCIYSWVKDPAKDIIKGKKNVSCAIAHPKEIEELIKKSINIGAHSADDLQLLKPGDIITLRGYPWDGMEAELLAIDEKRQRVKVRLLLFSQLKEVDVSYDNVFFTIYHNNNHDDSVGESRDSLDAMADKNSYNKTIFKNTKHESS